MSAQTAPFSFVTKVSIAASFAVLAAAVVASPRSVAAVTPLSSYREVVTFGTFVLEGQGSGPFEIDERTSNAFGTFDDTASTNVASGETFVAASASQASHWGSSLFTFDAAFDCQAGLDNLDVFAEGFGDAVATVHFQVDEPTTATLAGLLTATGNGATSLQLETAESSVLVSLGGSNGAVPVNESMLLAPGIYILRLVTGGYGREFPSTGPSPASGSIAATVTFATPTSAPLVTAGTSAAIALHPNPLRDTAVIRLGRALPLGAAVFVFDAKGRRVRTIAPASTASLTWDARDDSGTPLAPGVYFVRAGDAPAIRATIVR